MYRWQSTTSKGHRFFVTCIYMLLNVNYMLGINKSLKNRSINCDVNGPLWRHQKAVPCLSWDQSISNPRRLSRTPWCTRQRYHTLGMRQLLVTSQRADLIRWPIYPYQLIEVYVHIWQMRHRIHDTKMSLVYICTIVFDILHDNGACNSWAPPYLDEDGETHCDTLG